MGYFSKQLKRYLSSATPEQLEQDYKSLESYNSVGPYVEDYLSDIANLPNMNINTDISPEFCLGFNF